MVFRNNYYYCYMNDVRNTKFLSFPHEIQVKWFIKFYFITATLIPDSNN